jgi:hypothetical protein
MAKILVANCMSYDDMLKTSQIFECEYDCQVGDIVNEYFVCCGRSPISNALKKGDMTWGIPLKFIAIAETHADLSQYGFYKANKEDRWIRYT